MSTRRKSKGEPEGSNPLGPTLRDCLRAALPHWAGRRGSRVMSLIAARVVTVAGLDVPAARANSLMGVSVLASLRKQGLSARSVAQYYSTLRRVLALNGFSTVDWPKAPSIPRVKSREPMSDEDFGRLVGHLRGIGGGETADFAILLKGTGMRGNVEALDPLATTASFGDTFDTLTIRGKGGHERVIPVLDPDTRALLRDAGRMGRLRALSASSHTKRWAAAIKELGVSSRLPTPHSLRHAYATGALVTTGGNLRLVQELLGHSDPKTTAGYIAVDMEAKAKALSSG